MEMELREQLLVSDHGLRIAWHVYGLDEYPERFEYARNAVNWQIRDGLIQLLCKNAGRQRILEQWEVKQVLADEEQWHKRDEQTAYFLHLTAEGAKLI